jgi:hypothetical protein
MKPPQHKVISVGMCDAPNRITQPRSGYPGALHEVRRHHLARALSDWSAAELQQFDRLLTKFFEDTTKTPINGGGGQAR